MRRERAGHPVGKATSGSRTPFRGFTPPEPAGSRPGGHSQASPLFGDVVAQLSRTAESCEVLLDGHNRAIVRGRARKLEAVDVEKLRAEAVGQVEPLVDQLVERAKPEVVALIRDPDHANWYRQLVASPAS